MTIRELFVSLQRFLDLSGLTPSYSSSGFIASEKGSYVCPRCKTSDGEILAQNTVSVADLLEGFCDCGWERLENTRFHDLRAKASSIVGVNRKELDRYLQVLLSAESGVLPELDHDVLKVHLVNLSDMVWNLPYSNPSQSLGWTPVLQGAVKKVLGLYRERFFNDFRYLSEVILSDTNYEALKREEAAESIKVDFDTFFKLKTFSSELQDEVSSALQVLLEEISRKVSLEREALINSSRTFLIQHLGTEGGLWTSFLNLKPEKAEDENFPVLLKVPEAFIKRFNVSPNVMVELPSGFVFTEEFFEIFITLYTAENSFDTLASAFQATLELMN